MTAITLVKRRQSDDQRVRVGTAEIDARGLVTLTEASETMQPVLQMVLDQVNALETITVTVAPTPGSEAYSLSSRSFARGDDDIFDGVNAWLERNHAISLQR